MSWGQQSWTYCGGLTGTRVQTGCGIIHPEASASRGGISEVTASGFLLRQGLTWGEGASEGTLEIESLPEVFARVCFCLLEDLVVDEIGHDLAEVRT